MKRSLTTAVGLAAAASLVLAGCSGDGDSGGGDGDAAADGPVELTLAGWSLSTTPEFQVLADAFHEAEPDITVELQEYSADDYDTQMTADLAAGSAPDMYAQKTLAGFTTYQGGGQLMDVSDVAGGFDDDTKGVEAYEVDGVTYAVPYRQDSWYLYYNQDLFDEAGVDAPDGSWTWDDYVATAKELDGALGDGVDGTYEHTWQSTLQGFANSQSPDGDILSGDYAYFKPYYEKAVDLQDSGAQVDYGTATTNSLSYQAQFGTQKTAMMLMGSWYVATLLAQVESGDADEFAWGIAPAPQLDASTTDNPVTFGDPTGVGINPAIDESKADAAKKFLSFIGGADAAAALAEIGITPAYQADSVVDAYFAVDGVPGDDLSKFTFATHETAPENPVAPNVATVQAILGDMHSAIMSGTSSIDDAIAEAQDRAKSEADIG
ncbi:sugar ABC transporter substrate-binding protein [Paraoerskovia sediminicola]|uniref:Sugar ABC transporter substrate-binding protein n=1 Tax=Paraoerskovia sediminicola TaxID=1138587 RepID=A0ABN6X9P1_9CELL|nr:extracellular solute-binding protein [Paraoerskovia sediminicola]BDZ41472.1 sugar ABC transporter substrate-binding protein [Paraoerskovia sediminicola]